MLLIGNGKLLTRDPKTPFIENGAVLCEGSTVKEVGSTASLKERYKDAEWIDAKGGLIMPGLINAHSHIYSAFARGLSINGFNPSNFLEVLDGQWWKIDKQLDVEGSRYSAYQTYIDSIKNGVTTVFDHHASYGQTPGSLFAIDEVARELSIRTSLCYEVSDRNGEAQCNEAIRENADFIRHTQKQNDSMVKAMFGLHASFTLSNKTLELCQQENPGVGYHIHIAEGMADVYDALKAYGKRTVFRLHDMGILGEDTIAGHCIHVNDAEMELLKQTGTMVVNNPESNMGNAVGCSPVLQMFAKGILLGLGTDAYTHDMLESLKVALCIQRHNACLPNVGWNEVTSMLFKGNSQIATRQFGVELGVIRPGAAADIAVFDYKTYTPFSDQNADGHILFGLSGKQCTNTVCNGKILMKDRELVCCDEEKINAKTLEVTTKFWKNINS
ncbi:putative aminohydrolase SsnA [Eubacteriales bacterium OttesenSCG-928-K08]|nr:putative aminohydrolase SsnA [Eubacteriales bacterium OttesenSCG-928-K08]